MQNHPYHDLIVWKEAYAFVLDVYEATKRFPSTEKFGVTSQLQRAAVSIILNIAEGQGKQGPKDFLRFCDIARGSLRESSVLLELSRDLQYIDSEQYKRLDGRLRQAGYLLSKLMLHLKSKPVTAVRTKTSS